MSPTPSVLIGIVNFNRAGDTLECIGSLKGVRYPNPAITVLDNGSTDDSAERIRAAHPDVTLLRSERNLGAAGARNRLFGHAREKGADYLLVLDNDTVVDEGFLEPLVRAMEDDPGAVTACGTILEYGRRDVIWFGGGRLIPFRGMAVHERVGERFDPGASGGPRAVSYLTVCMTLYRGSALDRIGWQDERYFVYLEDIEHSARIHRSGGRQLYVPASVIYHKVGGERESAFRLYYCVRNRFLLIREGFGGPAGAVGMVYYLLAISLKLVYWKFRNPRLHRAALAGVVDYFGGRYGEGRGTTLFADVRTAVPGRRSPGEPVGEGKQ